jgi:hypothetical protein
MVFRIISPGLKLPGSEADHTSSSSAEINIKLIYISNPPISLNGTYVDIFTLKGEEN